MTYGQCDEVDVDVGPLRFLGLMAVVIYAWVFGTVVLGLVWPPAGRLYAIGIFPAGLALAALLGWAIDSHRQDS